MTTTRLRTLPLKTILAASLSLIGGGALAQTATETELARRLDQLATELAAVKAQLAQMQQQRAAAPLAPATPAAAAAPEFGAPVAAAQPGTGAAPGAVLTTKSEPSGPATVLTSYGEITYNRTTRATQNTQADMARFVLGYEHRFDARTKVVTELEVEHAVSSADDAGEVEVEQAYVEYQITPNLAVQGGLFLVPVGLLNGNHEPTAYYGVNRNFVETAIIPTTWREGGVQLVGTFDNGMTLQGGITTTFDLTKWDASSSNGLESPLGSIHQELSLAKAHDLAGFGAVNWRGIPALQLGGSVFSSQALQGQAAETARITLWEMHGRWTPGRWDFQSLYSRGTISNTAALNMPLVGNPTLIPESFDGFYVLGAYKLWTHEDFALSPFVRWEQVNTARSYANLGPGLTPDAARTERIVTAGLNLMVTQGVVLKADYQRFRENSDLNRFSLGLGWNF